MEIIQDSNVSGEAHPEVKSRPSTAFGIHQIILKQLAFDAPVSPRAFRAELDAYRKHQQADPAKQPASLEPLTETHINIYDVPLNKDHHEVTLRIRLVAKRSPALHKNQEEVSTKTSNDEILFSIEVEQVGLFHIKGYQGEALKRMHYIACPNVLHPYAREEISRCLFQSGYPSLYLAPINFEALYRLKAEQDQAAQTH